MTKPRPVDETLVHLALTEAETALRQAWSLIGDNLDTSYVLNRDWDRSRAVGAAISQIHEALKLTKAP